jgi:hypothetical protein
MSAIEPAGEKIVRNLQQAVERLHDDLARVELWAGALGCFTKPIPDYGHGQTKFDLPTAKSKSPERESETPAARQAASKARSPRRYPAADGKN